MTSEEVILAEIKRCGMCDTGYIRRKFRLTLKEAKTKLSYLEKQGKVKLVPCGKWFFKSD
jgi:hypothetical protein